MNISSNPSAAAAQQIIKSAEMMNNLNQKITDASQDISNKMLKITVESKISNQQNQARLDLLA